MGSYHCLIDRAAQIVSRMEGAFTRRAAFGWFGTSVVGTMARADHLGATSVVRALGLDGDRAYESLLHSFRSEAWSAAGVAAQWCRAVREEAPLIRRSGRLLLPLDGVKVVKEGARMPGVKRQHQDSGDSGKPEAMFGHLFGCVGALAGESLSSCFCVPLSCGLQDGMRAAASWEGSPFSADTHVVQAARQAWEAAEATGEPAYAIADRYFLAKTALEELARLDGMAWRGLSDEGAPRPLVHLLSKAKSTCVAFGPPPQREPGRAGRPAKRGAPVRLASLFSDGTPFEAGAATISGEEVPFEFLVRDLLWGEGLYAEMRFVLVRCRGYETVLATTDRSMSARDAVELYAARFGIECSFRAMKSDVGAFGYRFWTLACPELDRYAKAGSPDRLEAVCGEGERRRVLACAEAVARFVAVCCVATGVAQILALSHPVGGELDSLLYKRTRGRAAKVSERTVLAVFRDRAREWVLCRKGDGPAGRLAGFIRSKTPQGRLGEARRR